MKTLALSEGKLMKNSTLVMLNIQSEKVIKSIIAVT